MVPPRSGGAADARPTVPSERRIFGFFLRGLAALLPAVLTVFVFVSIGRFVNDYVTGPVNRAVYWTLDHNALGWRVLAALGVDPYADELLSVDALPQDLRRLGETRGYSDAAFARELARHRAERESFWRDAEALAVDGEQLRDRVRGRVTPLVGVVLSILLVLWIGWVVGGYLGRQVLARVERALAALPGVRAVYPHTKQLVDFFLAEKKRTAESFQTVVAVPYPSEPLWSLGFVTNRAPAAIAAATGMPMVVVFVPSSPIPMTGYTVSIPEDRVVHLSMSVDDALKMIVSGGVLLPAEDVASARGAEVRR